MHDEIIHPDSHLDKAYPCSQVRSSQVHQMSPQDLEPKHQLIQVATILSIHHTLIQCCCLS